MGKKRFAASVTGDESTEASRLGNKNIWCHIRGWDHGIKVRGHVNEDGREVFEIFMTGDSTTETCDEYDLEAETE